MVLVQRVCGRPKALAQARLAHVTRFELVGDLHERALPVRRGDDVAELHGGDEVAGKPLVFLQLRGGNRRLHEDELII